MCIIHSRHCWQVHQAGRIVFHDLWLDSEDTDLLQKSFISAGKALDPRLHDANHHVVQKRIHLPPCTSHFKLSSNSPDFSKTP